MAEKKALVDSGATENFIDWRLAKALKVQTMLLPRPRKVYNVDGMENKAGVIERHVRLRVLSRFFLLTVRYDRTRLMLTDTYHILMTIL
jgi:hypothetical protein